MIDEELIKALTIQLNKMEQINDKLMKDIKRKEANNTKLKKVLREKIKKSDEYLKSQMDKCHGDLNINYYYAERDKKIYQQVLELVKELEDSNG